MKKLFTIMSITYSVNRRKARSRNWNAPQERLRLSRYFGTVYTLTPKNTGLEDFKQLNAYLEGIDRAPLLAVTDAQEVMREVQEQRRAEWQLNKPLNETDGAIRLAYSLTQTGQEFADALEDRGYILTMASPADVAMHERRAPWREQERIERLQAYGIDPAARQHQPETPLSIGTFLLSINTAIITSSRTATPAPFRNGIHGWKISL